MLASVIYYQALQYADSTTRKKLHTHTCIYIHIKIYITNKMRTAQLARPAEYTDFIAAEE